MREQDHLSDRGHPGDQHHQPVDAHSETTARWQSVLERTHVIIVYFHRLLFAAGAQRGLLFQARALIDGIGELAERVHELAAEHHDLEALDETWVVAMRPGERW